MSDETMMEVIARSSLGGAAWCNECKHPDLVHEPSGCFDVGPADRNGETWTCSCEAFRPMTPAEWLTWKDTV